MLSVCALGVGIIQTLFVNYIVIASRWQQVIVFISESFIQTFIQQHL